jgi:hypothetical protein
MNYYPGQEVRAGSGRKRPQITGKNPKIFRLEYCLHVLSFSGRFLLDPATFPSLSGRFQWNSSYFLWPESLSWVEKN